jgi:hypothetical protein
VGLHGAPGAKLGNAALLVGIALAGPTLEAVTFWPKADMAPAPPPLAES